MSMWGGPNPGGTPPAFGALPPFCLQRGAHAVDVRQGNVLAVAGELWAGVGNSYAWQWFRDATAIAGATNATYTLVAADKSARIRRRTIATNAAGGSDPVFTDATNAVKPPLQAPVAVVAPAIIGTPQVGRVAAITDGEFLGGPISRRRFGWLRNGALLPGDADKVGTRTYVAADEGAMMVGRQWIEGTDGVELMIDTVAVGPIAAAASGGGAALDSLSLSAASLPEDVLATISIVGATAGSAIVVQGGALPGGMTLDGGARTISGTPPTPGTYNFTLREMLAGSPNSPRDSALSLTVTAGVGVWPFPYVPTRDVVTWGSSTINGGIYYAPAQVFVDDTGATYIGSATPVPGSGPLVAVNRGNGGDNGKDIKARLLASSAREKAANTIIHMVGNYSAETIPLNGNVATVNIAHMQEMLGVGGVTHDRYLIAAKHPDGGVSLGGQDWSYGREFID